MPTALPALSQIAADPPAINQDVIAECVADQYGLSGAYAGLVSERDQNFRLTTASGERFVVKIVSSAEETATTDFQIAGLLHLEAAGLGAVPRIVRTKAGKDCGGIDCDGIGYRLRVVTYLDGDMLQHSEVNPKLARDFGKRLAELDLAFQDFSHAGEKRALLWDIQKAAELRALVMHISDASLRTEVDAVLERFDSRVLPQLADLRAQVIHNDANTENVLVDDSRSISGFIDFGDMLRAPLIVEVAVAAAYLRSDGEDPARLIAPFVRGYHEKCPLEDQEFSVLFDLVRTRVATTIVLLYWRLDARATNDRYRQKTLRVERGAMRFLQALNAQGEEAFLERVAGAQTIP